MVKPDGKDNTTCISPTLFVKKLSLIFLSLIFWTVKIFKKV